MEATADNEPPRGPAGFSPRAWWTVLKRTVREFQDDNLTDWAAALTYYSALSMFPALIVLVAILGLFGTDSTTSTLLDIVDQLGPASAVDTFRGPVESIVDSKGGAGIALVLALLGALWSASGYVGAFMRASNAIYEVEEGRPFWKRRPMQVVVTLVCLIVLAIVLLSIVVTGPVARAVGDAVGVGDATVTVWQIAKWPVLFLLALGILALLYYSSPNVKPTGIRWITPGTVLAVVIAVIASGAFAVFVANFGSYNKTYGSLAGVFVFLVWLWLINTAVLLGAELDAELERERALAAGTEGAERRIPLEPRDEPS